jgi:hypothetical protein
MSKIGTSFGISNQYTSPHDTAILIDSTGSMNSLLNKYKDEAMRLAEKTLESGGRVALYDYRDLKEGYTPVERCNFETCTLEPFRAGLDEISPYGGGDAPESLLSASFQVMKQLDWSFGSTKSLVVLTDDTYHEPDLDGTTFYDVQKLSKQIDPVNFYIITPKVEAYQTLAEATGGAVASSMDDLGLLTDSILERFDSLPRVEEEFEDEHYENNIPVVNIDHVEEISDESVKISFTNSGEAVVVILNDGIIGTTYEKEVTITGLKTELDNQITLVPLSTTRRGVGATIEKPHSRTLDESEHDNNTASIEGTKPSSACEEIVIPKAPNTGKK